MFRRMTDGALKESTTGVLEKKKRVRRRRRRKKDAPPPVGEEGRYNFIGSVGEGAMGKVHLAEDTRLNRKVAFKAMSDEIAKEKTLASKFTSEAQITAQLDHPNIVPIYNLETPSSYTMKLIKGITVEDLVNECKAALTSKQPLDEVHSLNGRLDLFLRACDAMFYAHSRGVVHRDLKPENVMVGEFNELYVMDWGISRLMPGEFEDGVQLGDVIPEDDELVIGTPGYMSPEQAEGQNNALDGRSDQYSLGLILFELVTLKPAVTGKTAIKMVMRHQDGEKEPMVHVMRQKIAPELRAIIHKATAKNPAARYASVKALGDDVRRYLREEAVLARPDHPIQRLLRVMGRHRQLTLFIMMALFMGSGTITISALAYEQINGARREARQQVIQNLLTRTAGQSSLIDGKFVKYEGLLSLISVTSEDSLARVPRGNPTLYTNVDFDENKPPNLIDGKRFDSVVSLEYPSYVIAPDTRKSAVQGAMAQLSVLDRHYSRTLLRSHSEGAASWTQKRVQRAITDVGVPIASVYVGLASGLFSGFPGHGAWPDDFDHRDQAWYSMAQAKRGPNWGAPHSDLGGTRLVLTCSQPLYDTEDNFLGVAGIDVTFDYIIQELLVMSGFEDAPNTEAFLLDPEGNIVIRSNVDSEVGPSEGPTGALAMSPFPHETLVEKIKEKRSGSQEVSGDNGTELVFYYRMNSIGWYYVISGPDDELLELAD
ncbi:MAG: protein kinase [Rhodobacterales bacterium]|nr:protein kinase [Rhodobacterales bacterium]